MIASETGDINVVHALLSRNAQVDLQNNVSDGKLVLERSCCCAIDVLHVNKYSIVWFRLDIQH